MGPARGRVFLGAGIQLAFLRRLKKGGAKITKTYRLYDLDEPPGTAQAMAAEDGRAWSRLPAGGRRLGGRWKSAPFTPAAISTTSSSSRGAFTPTIRTGCRRC